MIRKITYQKGIVLLTWLLFGVIALGSLLDAISNSITLPTKLIYIILITILVCWLFAEILLKVKPIKWIINNNQEIVIKKLGLKIRIVLLGMIILLGIPLIIRQILKPAPTDKFWTVKVYDFTNLGLLASKNQIGERLSSKILDHLLKKNFQAQKGKTNDSHFKGTFVYSVRGGYHIDSNKYPTPYIIIYGVIYDESQKPEKYELELRVSAFSSEQPQGTTSPFPLLMNHYEIIDEPEHIEELAQEISDKLISLIECYPPDKYIKDYVEWCQP